MMTLAIATYTDADNNAFPAIVTAIDEEAKTGSLLVLPPEGAEPYDVADIKISDEGEADSFKVLPAPGETYGSAGGESDDGTYGGFNVLSLLGGDIANILGTAILMAYMANKTRIEDQADRIMTPPEKSMLYVCDRLGIKDDAGREKVVELARAWGVAGGELLSGLFEESTKSIE